MIRIGNAVLNKFRFIKYFSTKGNQQFENENDHFFEYSAPRDFYTSKEDMNRKIRRYLILFPLIFLFTFDCLFIKRNSITYRRRFQFINSQIENWIGRKESQFIEKMYKGKIYKTSSEESIKINNISKIIANSITDKEMENKIKKIKCKIVNDTKPCLYMTLEGTFYISNSILNYCESDDEIAYIVAHFIYHYLLDHLQEMRINFWIRNFTSSIKYDFYKYNINFGSCFNNEGWTINEDIEREADIFSQKALQTCNWDNYKALNLIKRMSIIFKQNSSGIYKKNNSYDRVDVNNSIISLIHKPI